MTEILQGEYRIRDACAAARQTGDRYAVWCRGPSQAGVTFLCWRQRGGKREPLCVTSLASHFDPFPLWPSPAPPVPIGGQRVGCSLSGTKNGRSSTASAGQAGEAEVRSLSTFIRTQAVSSFVGVFSFRNKSDVRSLDGRTGTGKLAGKPGDLWLREAVRQCECGRWASVFVGCGHANRAGDRGSGGRSVSLVIQ